MSDATATRMDAIEIADFLATQHTGVLSLASDDDAYAVPVSFAYDDADSALYLRLGYAPGSQKRTFVDAVDRASFVVYDDTPDGWRSVVARGRLEELSESSLDSSIVESVRGLDIPYFQVHDRPATDLEFHVVRLDVTELTGVAEA